MWQMDTNLLEAVISSEMLVPFYKSRRYHILEDHSLDTDSCENFRYHIQGL
jgi:hypothetical protein